MINENLKCSLCHNSYSFERRKTINLHTDLPVCVPCDGQLSGAQYNYRKWGLKIGRELKWAD